MGIIEAIKKFKAILNSIAKEGNWLISDNRTLFTDIITIGALEGVGIIGLIEEDDRQLLLDIKKKYNEKQGKLIGDALLLIHEELNNNPRDVLGELYMGLGLNNKNKGQFFTPYNISKAMAELEFADISKETYNKELPIRMLDCCCGSGGLLLSAGNVLKQKEFNSITDFVFYAQDIDRLCVFMTYIQLSYSSFRCEVVLGDSLLFERKKVYRNFYI